jgi:predicted esterase
LPQILSRCINDYQVFSKIDFMSESSANQQHSSGAGSSMQNGARNLSSAVRRTTAQCADKVSNFSSTPSSGSGSGGPLSNPNPGGGGGQVFELVSGFARKSWGLVQQTCSSWIFRAAVVVWVVGAGASSLVTFLEEGLLYHPRFPGPQEASSWPVQVNSFSDYGYLLETMKYGKGQVAYLLLPEKADFAKVWVLMGGNAMIGTDWLDWVGQYLSTNRPGEPPVGFLLLDYPGYNRCEGKPSPQSSLEAHKLALYQLKETVNSRYGKASHNYRLGFFGHSLGCAALLQLAAESSIRSQNRLDKIVLSSPFLSVPHMAQILFPFIPASYAKMVVSHAWDNTESIKGVDKNVSVRILHAQQDQICPHAHGKKLSALAKKQGLDSKFQSMPQGGHNDLLWIARHAFFEHMRQ